MYLNDFPEIRNDDILQMAGITHHQKADMAGRSLYQCFLEGDKIFEEYNYPCTLAVLSEGMIAYSYNFDYVRWVTHIKKNKHRYRIELHGSNHINYRSINKDELRKELGEAKKKIEDTFETHITTWYQPFGRKGEHPDMDEVCRDLGITAYHQKGKVDAKIWLKEWKKNKRWIFPHMNFHYWNRPQVAVVNEIIETLCNSPQSQ